MRTYSKSLKIKSIYYHDPNPEGFEKMILHFKKMGYRFIDLDELYLILVAKLQINEKLVFVSFDDGWRGNLRLIPIIEKYSVPICVFVSTQPLVEGNFWWEYVKNELGTRKMFDFKSLSYEDFYMQLDGFKQRNHLERSALTIEELELLSKHPLVTIQSHTVNHPILTNSPDDVLDMELRASQIQLSKITGNEVYAFSYPNGSLTEREVSACSHYYKIAFTTEQNHISINDNILCLPRYALMGGYVRDLLKIWGIWKLIKRLLNNYR